MSGLDRILWVGAAGALVGAVLTVLLIRPRDFHGSPEQQQRPGGLPRRHREPAAAGR